MFPFCAERGARLFCLIFRGFLAAVARLACIFLYVGPFSAAFLFLFFVEELV